ncbi:MAG: class I adenylate-forming enzyme family protein [Gammaproteobacteria bacterium]
MNLAGLLRQHAFGRAENTALVYHNESISYAELWRRTVSLSSHLRKTGVLPGQRVGVALGDHPSYITSYFAVAALGAIFVPIDQRWSTAEKLAAIETFDVRLYLHDIGDKPPPRQKTLACPTAGFTDGPADMALVSRSDTDWLVSLSSGSTGRPKGALITQRQMHARFVTQWVSLGFSSADRFALVTPLHFGAGRSFGMSVLAAGGTLVLLPPPMKPEQLVDAICAAEANVTFMVPTLMRRCLELPGTECLLPTLRSLVISGEAYFKEEVASFQQRLCPHLLGYYASSEGGGVSVLQASDFETLGNTVGQAAYGVELELVDDTDTLVGPDQIGRVRYRGPGVTQRALDDQGQSESGSDGWFYPGDLGSRSADGYLTLRGRAKDMIVRAGVNIYPAEIEAALISLEGVREVAVVGVPSSSHGEQVLAFVVGDAAHSALVAHCESVLAPYKRPRDIHVLDALPRTAAGKIDKKVLREEDAVHAVD